MHEHLGADKQVLVLVIRPHIPHVLLQVPFANSDQVPRVEQGGKGAVVVVGDAGPAHIVDWIGSNGSAG